MRLLSFLTILICMATVSAPAFAQEEEVNTSVFYSCRLKQFDIQLTYDEENTSASVLELKYPNRGIETFNYMDGSEQANRHRLKCEQTGDRAMILTDKSNKGIIKITLSLKGKEKTLILDARPHPTSIDVFVSDDTGSDTNLRNAPKGKIVGKLPKSGTYMMNICDATNGWWRICSNEVSAYTDNMEGEIPAGTEGVAWIHYSVLGTSTRNYGGETLHLRDSPSEKARVTYSFKKELELRPIEEDGRWIKVETTDKKHRGWIDSYWLCGNALTTCP